MQINSWLGIRNTSPPRSIPDNALSDAVNIDIDDAGIITRRNGSSLSVSISNVTNAYTTMGGTSYVIANGNLYRVNSDLSLYFLAPSSATAFADFEDVLFTNDGLRIINDAVFDLKIPVPTSPPMVTVTPGDLPAGIYGVMFCYQSESGSVEGGTSPVTMVEVPDNSGLSVNNLPAISGFRTIVYMTDAGGSVYYSDYGIALSDFQKLAESFPEDPEQIALYESKLYLSKSLGNGSSIVWFSQPYHYHLYNVEQDYFILNGTVLGMLGVESGLLIGTDSGVYLYAGQGGAITRLSEYGVVPGRSFVKKNTGEAFIFTTRGMCSFPPFKNMTEAKHSFATGVNCSTSLVDQDGIMRFVALTDGSGQPYNARS